MDNHQSEIADLTKEILSSDHDNQFWQQIELNLKGKLDLLLLHASVREAQSKADERADRVRQRKRYAKVFIGGAAGWIGLVLCILLLDGFSVLCFEQSDAVIMVLLGTGTVNVLTPAYLVAKHLFGP